MSGPPTTRSGCALALGLLLIVTGALLLASNLFGFSLAGFWTRGLIMFSLYWPVLLILWGAIKIYQRFYNPAAARVSAGEVVLLILIICAGVTLAAARYVAGTASIDLSMDDLLEMIEPDILTVSVRSTLSSSRRAGVSWSRTVEVPSPPGVGTNPI
jgi:hypothetical protein